MKNLALTFEHCWGTGQGNKQMKRMGLKAKLTMQNVGQGLFYCGNLKFFNKNNDFNFVYDCGSENRSHLNRIINNYKKEISPNLDLLIISHLHDDHIIGLENLLEGINVDTVILPYMSPLERLTIALKKINLPRSYYEFLEEPIQYLLKKGVRRIVLVGGTSGASGPSFYKMSTELSDIKMDINTLRNDKLLEEHVLDNEPEIKKFIDEEKLLIKNHFGYISIFGLWGFRFFNYEVDHKKLQSFKKCIDSIVDGTDVKEFIKSKARLKSLRPCYETIFGRTKLNNTSLSVFTGPLGNYKKIYSIPNPWLFNLKYCDSICPYSNDDEFFNNIIPPTRWIHHIGNLLTGDIDMNLSWNNFINHFRNNLPQTFLVQIPHHGSRYNWNNNILNEINDSIWLVTAGLKNRFGHPHNKVIRDIYSHFPEKTIYWISDFWKFEMDFRIIW